MNVLYGVNRHCEAASDHAVQLHESAQHCILKSLHVWDDLKWFLIIKLFCLIGAFYTGCPVQPVAIRYPNRLVSDEWKRVCQPSSDIIIPWWNSTTWVSIKSLKGCFDTMSRIAFESQLSLPQNLSDTQRVIWIPSKWWWWCWSCKYAEWCSLRRSAPISTAHPYSARKFTFHVMHRASARAKY